MSNILSRNKKRGCIRDLDLKYIYDHLIWKKGKEELEKEEKYIYKVMKRSLFRISFSFGVSISYVGMFEMETG